MNFLNSSLKKTILILFFLLMYTIPAFGQYTYPAENDSIDLGSKFKYTVISYIISDYYEEEFRPFSELNISKNPNDIYYTYTFDYFWFDGIGYNNFLSQYDVNITVGDEYVVEYCEDKTTKVQVLSKNGVVFTGDDKRACLDAVMHYYFKFIIPVSDLFIGDYSDSRLDNSDFIIKGSGNNKTYTMQRDRITYTDSEKSSKLASSFVTMDYDRDSGWLTNFNMTLFNETTSNIEYQYVVSGESYNSSGGKGSNQVGISSFSVPIILISLVITVIVLKRPKM